MRGPQILATRAFFECKKETDGAWLAHGFADLAVIE
jgi:hypothetical protein